MFGLILYVFLLHKFDFDMSEYLLHSTTVDSITYKQFTKTNYKIADLVDNGMDFVPAYRNGAPRPAVFSVRSIDL